MLRMVIYIPLEGFRYLSRGGINPLEGFRYPSYGFIIPLEGFRNLSRGFIIPLEGFRYLSRGFINPLEEFRYLSRKFIKISESLQWNVNYPALSLKLWKAFLSNPSSENKIPPVVSSGVKILLRTSLSLI